MASDELVMPTMAQATAAFLKSDWYEAKRLYEEGLQLTANPSMRAVGKSYLSLSLAHIGYQYADRSSLNRALTEAREAVRIFEQTDEPLDSVAVAHQAIGMTIGYMIAKEVIRREEWPTLYPEGIAALKKATQLDPQNAEARRHLGILYSAQRVAKMYGAKTGGCFIATATYGSPFAPEVLTFRQFRDHVLLSSASGFAFVRFYYFVSPSIATLISRHKLLRTITKQLVLEPILWLLQKRKEL